MKPDAVRVVIHGRVQGVSYRAWTTRKANELGLKGWVRNRPDGTVEAVFAGDALAMDMMIESCKIGPSAARVDRIESFVWNETIEGEQFLTKATG